MPDLAQTLATERRALSRWFTTALGQRVMGTEQALHDELLEDLFGYHLIQLSAQGMPLFQKSPILNKVWLGEDDLLAPQLIASPLQVPIASDQVDLVLLHHLLEFSDRPQALLAESARMVMPMGTLIITAFNPLSLWGLRQRLSGPAARYPFKGHFWSAYRLMDWLNLLNFKVDRVLFADFGVPWSVRRLPPPSFGLGLGRRYNLPSGGVYILVARKVVGPLTPVVSPSIRRSIRFSGLGLSQPGTGGLTPSRRTESVVEVE
jgi:hypothetical protein